MIDIRQTRGDITEFDKVVDVIVNAWNQNFIPHQLLLASGVSATIKKKAGTKPFEELQKAGFLKLGQGVLTSPGDLKCKGIIHVAGIDVLWRSSEKGIRDSIGSILGIMNVNGFTSVAIPLIGCGEGKFPETICAQIIKEELFKSHLNAVAYIVKYPKVK